MNRRATLAFVGAVFALPLGTLQLAAAGLPRVGILDPGLPQLWEAFFSGMYDFGYVEGQNVEYYRRSSADQPESVSQLANELVIEKLDVIVTAGPTAVRALMSATSTIPIVFAALGDALGAGVVTSLAHPNGNATGFSFLNPEISSKRVELLHEAVPHARRVAILRDRLNSGADLKQTLQAAETVGLETQLLEVTRSDEYEDAFRAAIEAHAEAINILASPIFNANRERLIGLAAQYRLPAIYETSEYVRSGGLMSYGPSLADLFRRAAGDVVKLLQGARIADLPVEQPTKFEFVINLKTGRSVGLAIPQSLLARADEVIE